MEKSLSKRRVFTLIVLIAVLLLVIYFENRPRSIPGQTPLTDIQNIETLRTQFNHDVGQIRLIILVSPT